MKKLDDVGRKEFQGKENRCEAGQDLLLRISVKNMVRQ